MQDINQKRIKIIKKEIKIVRKLDAQIRTRYVNCKYKHNIREKKKDIQYLLKQMVSSPLGKDY